MREWSLGVVGMVYEELVRGSKTVETRAPDPSNPEKNYGAISIEDILAFHAVDENFARVADKPVLKYSVSCVKSYKTVEEMLNAEGLDKVLPGINSVQEAIAVYDSFPGYKERIREHGIIAIRLGNRF